jgi:hypothetical protein
MSQVDGVEMPRVPHKGAGQVYAALNAGMLAKKRISITTRNRVGCASEA